MGKCADFFYNRGIRLGLCRCSILLFLSSINNQRGKNITCDLHITLPQLRQEKARRPQNLSLLNELEPAPLSLSLAPYI